MDNNPKDKQPKVLTDLPQLNYVSQQKSPTKELGNTFGVPIGNTDFGNSEYDKGYSASLGDIQSGDYKYARGEQQNALGQIGLGALRAVSKAGIEFLKTPAYLESLGEWAATNIASGGKGETLDKALDNSMLNYLEGLDESIKSTLPVYQSYKSGKGGILDNIMSTSFWATDGADGVGYLLGMMGPGYLVKSANLASKISKLGLGLEAAQKVELGTETLLNTFIESAAEAKGVADRLRNDGADPEKLANAAKETFFANMGVLLFPNMLANKAILGHNSPAKSLLTERYMDEAGNLLSAPTKRNLVKQYTKAALTGIGSEGFWEEGSQTSIENYEYAKALNKTNKDFLHGFIDEYINTLSTTQGQKSIVLGGAIGALTQIAGRYKENKNEDKSQPIISKLIDSNFQGLSSENDVFKRDKDEVVQTDDNGQPIFDTQKAIKTALQMASEMRDSKLSDIASVNNKQTLRDYIFHGQFTRWAIPFFEQGDLGVELIKEQLKKYKESDNAKQDKGVINDTQNFDKELYFDNLVSKADQLYKAYQSSAELASTKLTFLNDLKTTPKNEKYLEDYKNVIANVLFQEYSKQIFLKDKIKDLNLQLSKFKSTFFHELPQDKVLSDDIQDQIKSVDQIFQKSITAFQHALTKEGHQEAFDDFSEVQDIIKNNADKAEKQQPIKDQKQAKQDKEDNEFNSMFDSAINAQNLEQFNPLHEKLKDHVDITTEQKQQLLDKKKSLENDSIKTFDEINNESSESYTKENPIDENEREIEYDPNNDLVGQTLSTITDSNENQESQSTIITDNSEAINNTVEGKYFGGKATVVMMHLYNHIIKNIGGVKKFLFEKDLTTGTYKLDNISNLDQKALSDIKVNDEITFELEQWPDGLKAKYEHLEGFDGENIVIKHKGKRIGFVAQPHPISPDITDPTNLEGNLELLKTFRRKLIDKLSKGEKVSTKVFKKGNGGLYAAYKTSGKLKGNIDLRNNIFNDFREKDKIGNVLVFGYADKTGKLSLTKGSLTEKQTSVLEKHVSKYANYKFTPGRLFQMVRDISGGWSIIPVYSNIIDKQLANQIANELEKYDNDSKTSDIYKELNQYIYSSDNRTKASLYISKADGVITLKTNTLEFKLTDINDNQEVKSRFIEALQVNRQNITVSDINNSHYQESLKTRNALVTNIIPNEITGEYFIQPYIDFNFPEFVSDKPEVSHETVKNYEAPQAHTSYEDKSTDELTKALEEKLKKRTKNIDPDEYVSSKRFDNVPLDIKAFEKWLNNHLPQLNLADVKLLQEVKNNLVDNFGAYKDMLIYLFEGAGQKTAYHEAFHGVFRNLLSYNDKVAIIKAAQLNFPKPTDEDLSHLQEALINNYTKEELTYLYYEEKLADSFADYTHNYVNRSFLQKIGDTISKFFEKILNFFNLLNTSSFQIDKLFESINKGELKTTPKTEVKGISIFNRDLYNEFASSRELKGVFINPTVEQRTINSIGNKFVSLYQERLNSDKKISKNEIYLDIFDMFEKTMKDMLINEDNYNNVDISTAISVVKNKSKIVNAVNKFLADRKFNIKSDGTIETDDIKTENQDLLDDEDEFVVGEDKGVNRGLSDQVTISGLSSASTRLKMFLSSVPVLENGKHKKDVFGIEQFYNFNSIYYYIERNLTGVYTLKDQLLLLDKLSESRPELKTVINKLGFEAYEDDTISDMEDNINLREIPVDNISSDKLKLLQNDFKTNFSKQQLAYTLVKFDLNKATRQIGYKIIDSNRKSLGLELQQEWVDNISDINRQPLIENIKGETVINTERAEKLKTEWLKASDKDLTPKELNQILQKVGIDYSPETLKYVLDNPEVYDAFKRNLTTYINSFSDVNREANQSNTRKALRNLVDFEVKTALDNFTSSFNDVESKNIYSIQLPSFISKKLAIIKSDDENQFLQWYSDRMKDPLNKYSNLMDELRKNEGDFRTSKFKLSFLDGLKDNSSDRKGSKFTNMNPRDFMSMQIALFQNLNANQKSGEGQGKKIGRDIFKHIYITPSDKTMCAIVDMVKYNIGIEFDIKGHITIKRNSEVLTKFYNVFLSEINRIKHNIDLRNDIVNNKQTDKLVKLIEHYHITSGKGETSWGKLQQYIYKVKNNEQLSDKDWEEISKLFDGQAFKINNFEGKTSKHVISKIIDALEKAPIGADTKVLMETTQFEDKKNSKSLGYKIASYIQDELTEEVRNTLKEMGKKGLITGNIGSYLPVSIETPTKVLKKGTEEQLKSNKESINYEIVTSAAEFATNTMLANIELSNMFNGDKAQYKPGDLQKRTYQSQSMVTSNNFEDKTIKTIVVKDVKVGSQSIKDLIDVLKQDMSEEDIKKLNLDDYIKSINVTDAQVYITPQLYKKILIARGTWNDEISQAFDIANGKKVGKIDKSLIMLLGGIKPFYFGDRFDNDLGINRYEQVKCAMIPMFKTYLDMNPLLTKKYEDMQKAGAEMLAHESSFKAAIGFRDDITSYDNNILELDTDNFGIQVDNPVHGTDEENNSLRQLKMLLLGSVDPKKTYKNTSGQEVLDSIMSMESANINESLDELLKEIDIKNNPDFSKFVKEMVTKRGATTNVEDILNIVNNEFEFPLDNGILSTQIENLISSMFTNHAIRQGFAGDARVQATSLGVTYKNLKEQQDNLTEDAKLLQQNLRWIRPDKNGDLEYAECIMPAWSKKFFDETGHLKDINSIPDNLKELITYRIPTEGLHSMLPIKVVDFLPETMGNFILMPYEVTTQMGADFDFDKLYFINKEFHMDENGFNEYKYISGDSKEDIEQRWVQYVKYTSNERLEQLSREDWEELPVELQNVKAARNNLIIDNYLKILSSRVNMGLIIKPSGFEKMLNIKNEYFSSNINENFFSSRVQRDYKDRNHTGIALKGQSALHVSGHSYATLMNIKLKGEKGIMFNDHNMLEFNKLYTLDGSLITDELSSIMAAILDDIKNPILESLNITKNTIDVIATIIRSGYNIDTAIKFVSQLSIKELSKKLDLNTAKIKDRGQGWYTVNDIINEYQTALNDLIGVAGKPGKMNPDDINDPEFQELLNKLDNTNITDKELEQYIDKKTGFQTVTDVEKANSKEKAYYYAFQLRVLKSFSKIDTISKELVEINKFFSINKEVGPNIENIVSKQELLNNILNSDVLEEFDLSKIPTLQSTWRAHLKALDFFKTQFPYTSDLYMNVKKSIYNVQSIKTLDQVPVDDRQYINSFIGYYYDNKSGYFSNITSNYENIFVNLPKLLLQVKNLSNGDVKMGKVSYESIRNNLFIKNLKVVSDDFDLGVRYIQLKGNRYDIEAKNNMIEAFNMLYYNPHTQQLAKNLIDHSFASTGFYSGLNSFSQYINPEILKELGYMTERKDRVNEFNNGAIINQEELDRMIDQLVRNNPKLFTKVFETSMFYNAETGKPLSKSAPETIITDENMINMFGRANDMSTNSEGVPPRYIRVFDSSKFEAILYKLESVQEGKIVYKMTPLLSKKGFLMQVDPNNDIKYSFLSSNNKGLKSELVEDNPTTDEVEHPVIDSQDPDEQRAFEGFNEEPPDLSDEDKTDLGNQNDDPIDINC